MTSGYHTYTTKTGLYSDTTSSYITTDVADLNYSKPISNESNKSSGLSFHSQLAIYIVIGIFGLTGNSLVLLVMSKNVKMRKSMFNRLLMYQSLIDGMAALFVMISSYIKYDTVLNINSSLHDIYCRIWMTKFPMWGLFAASNFNLVILTIERYVNIIYPLQYKRIASSRRTYIIMTCTTFLCLAFIVIRDYNTSGLSPEGISQCFEDDDHRLLGFLFVLGGE